MIKEHFNKEIVMTKNDNQDFENSAKCWTFDNAYVDGDVKIRDHIYCIISYKRSLSYH